MKLNKVLVLTALSAGSMVASSSAFASIESMTTNTTSKASHWLEGKSGGSYADKMTDKMSEKLNLTDAQKEKVKSLFGQEHQQMSQLKENTSLTSDQKKSQMSEMRDSMDQKLKGILSPEQYQKWEKYIHPTSGTPSHE